MVNLFETKLKKLMNIEKEQPDVLTEMNDFKMIDSLTNHSNSMLSEDAFQLDLVSLKKELMESSNITILKAAAKSLKEAFNTKQMPATTIKQVSSSILFLLNKQLKTKRY